MAKAFTFQLHYIIFNFSDSLSCFEKIIKASLNGQGVLYKDDMANIASLLITFCGATRLFNVEST